MAKFSEEFCEYQDEFKTIFAFAEHKWLYITLEKETGKFVAAFEYLEDARNYIAGWPVIGYDGNEHKITKGEEPRQPAINHLIKNLKEHRLKLLNESEGNTAILFDDIVEFIRKEAESTLK